MTKSTQVGVKASKRGGKGSRPRAAKRPSPLDGPRRDVVYIFEREGKQGGAYWLLVLECGHSACRPRVNVNDSTAMVSAMFRPLSEKFAPKRVQCMYCGSGAESRDPWILVEAFGGPKKP